MSVVPINRGIEAASGGLATPEAARRALEEAGSAGESSRLRKAAQAAQECARLAGLSLEQQNNWAEIVLRAGRKAGGFLAVMPKNPGGRSTASTLPEVGINHTQSSRWQRIASIPEQEFEAYIAQAFSRGEQLTERGALKLAKQLKAAEKPAAAYSWSCDSKGPFSAVVIDPPWSYDNRGTRGAAEDHYPTLTIRQLTGEDPLPDTGQLLNDEIAGVSADNAHLYLWVTNPFLREGFALLDAWGFTYKTVITWVKPQMGMGNWFRGSTEHVLFAVKGRLPTLASDQLNWFTAPAFKANRTRHSQKPDAFYDLVHKCSPGPYLEMFARQRRTGWATWGNEA